MIILNNTLAPSFVKPTTTDHHIGCVAVYIAHYCTQVLPTAIHEVVR